jgi:RNA polymerase sigma factor (sigma-70 family)
MAFLKSVGSRPPAGAGGSLRIVREYGAFVTSAAQPSWSQVWNLYLENQEVFRAVIAGLRRGGMNLDDETAHDLAHEFLVERAREAVATFQPERGELKGWLYVVFKRFVQGAFRDRSRRLHLLEKFAVEAAAGANSGGGSEPYEEQAQQLRGAIAKLSAEQQRAVRTFLESPNQSVRDVARLMKISRWRASSLMAQALESLTTQLKAGDE